MCDDATVAPILIYLNREAFIYKDKQNITTQTFVPQLNQLLNKMLN